MIHFINKENSERRQFQLKFKIICITISENKNMFTFRSVAKE